MDINIDIKPPEAALPIELDISTGVSYPILDNKPQINGIELIGNKTAQDLGLQPKGDYALRSELPSGGDFVEKDELARVAFSGNYNDLSNKLVAGDNITISGNVISSTGGVSDAYTKAETNNLLNTKQDKGNYALKSEIPTKTSQLTNDSGFLTQHQDISGKQDKLTAGENITIEGNVISATGGGGVDGFYYGLNQYCPTNIDNDAWLLSDGTWYNGDDYSGLYNWILTQYSNGVADFHSSTDDYTEFSWVINQTDKTFRLPLFTGNESLAGGKTVVLAALPTDYSYIAPANGWYKFTFKATASAQQCYLYVSDNSRIVKFLSVKTETVAVCLFVTRGEEVILGYTTNNNYTFQFSYARGYGNLYFYAGEKAR